MHMQSFVVSIGISLIAMAVTGCVKPVTIEKHLSAEGPSTLIDSEGFQQIDLAILLDPDIYEKQGKKAEDIDPDSAAYRAILRNAFKNFYDRAVAPNRKLERNALQERILAASNQRCGEYQQYLKRLDTQTNIFLGGLTTVAAGAGAIFTGASTVRALSGAAAIISGLRAEINEQYFHSLTIQVITDGADARRREIYDEILERQTASIDAYPVQAAVKDAITYHSECSLLSGLKQAALSIERAENPGLFSIERSLLQVRRIRQISRTPLNQPLPASIALRSAPRLLGRTLLPDLQGEPVDLLIGIRASVEAISADFESTYENAKKGALSDQGNEAAFIALPGKLDAAKKKALGIVKSKFGPRVQTAVSDLAARRTAALTAIPDSDDDRKAQAALLKAEADTRKLIDDMQEFFTLYQKYANGAQTALTNSELGSAKRVELAGENLKFLGEKLAEIETGASAGASGDNKKKL